MKQNTVVIGFFYGVIMASRPDVSLYYVVFIFFILIAMFQIEKWVYKKIAEKKMLLGFISALIFTAVSGVSATLYIDFLTEPFFETIFLASIFSICIIYYPIATQR